MRVKTIERLPESMLTEARPSPPLKLITRYLNYYLHLLLKNGTHCLKHGLSLYLQPRTRWDVSSRPSPCGVYTLPTGETEFSLPCSLKHTETRGLRWVGWVGWAVTYSIRPSTCSLSGRLPALSGRLPALSGRLPALSGRLPALSGRLPALSGRLPALSGRLPALSGRLPALSDRLPTCSLWPSTCSI